MTNEKLFLIDGNSFMYRAYFAIKSLTNSKGQPTNAIYGFIKMLIKLLKEEKPQYLAVAFDTKFPTFRHKKFENYKIQRKPMPDDLSIQLPFIKEIINAYRIKIFEKAGFEADDILATIASRLKNYQLKIFIVTSDKDALQMVDKNIKVFNPYQSGIIYDEEKVKIKFGGISPLQIPDIMGLMGDSSDNIPGVPGIGEKTAIYLVKQFGSLEKILANLDNINSPKIKDLLVKYAEQAKLSKELSIVDTDVDIEVELKDLKRAEPDKRKLFDIFNHLEFKSLLEEHISDTDNSNYRNLNYKIITNNIDLKKLTQDLSKEDEILFHIYLQNAELFKPKIGGITFGKKDGSCFFIPVAEKYFKDSNYIFENLKSVLESNHLKKTGFNLKEEKLLLKDFNIELNGISFDCQIASYLLNPSKNDYSINQLALEYLNKNIADEPVLEKFNAEDMEKVLAEYNCQYVRLVDELKSVLTEQLNRYNLFELFTNVEMPLVEVISEMEFTGISIDISKLKQLQTQLKTILNILIEKIYEVAGEKFNINSSKQLGKILFDKLKLPVFKKTKTLKSTDTEVLAKLSLIHPLASYLLEYRKLQKIKVNYIDTLLKLVNLSTNKIHTKFNQTQTQTGRLSSSNPNLQNLPAQALKSKILSSNGEEIEFEFDVRACLVSNGKDWQLLSCDYSQIELRILAHFSKEPVLCEAFRKDEDIHKLTASLIFNQEIEKVTSSMRETAKMVNYGIIYGMNATGLARRLNLNLDEAKVFIDTYFKKYPGIKSFIQEQKEKAAKRGYVSTIFNRRRYLPDITSSNSYLRSFSERVAVNTPIQGSAADLIKISMINIYKKLKGRYKTKLILQIHDELVFDVPVEELAEIKNIVKNEMENACQLDVPIKVTIKTGKNLGQMKTE